jgi:hypothetical protein
MSNPIHNIEGDWKMALAGDGDKSAVCTLIQAGTILTGTFRGPLGDLPIEGALATDGRMAFTAKLIIGSFKFFGIVDGENMYGIVDFPIGKWRKNWTAIKVLDRQNS